MVNHFEAQWETYARNVLSSEAGAVQRQETMRAFYAGGTALFYLLLASLSPGAEPTDEDVQRLDELKSEFDVFASDVAEGRR